MDRKGRKVKDLPLATLAKRLSARLVETPSGCLEFTGCRSSGGYGCIGFQGKVIRSHVAAWLIENNVETVPAGKIVRHKCDNPPCCNPGHLLIGTKLDNVRDMHERGRARKAMGLANSNCRVPPDAVAEIRRRHVPGRRARTGVGILRGNTRELSVEFGISPQYVTMLAKGKWRKHA